MVRPSIWGPHGWKFLHYVTLGYPNEPTINDINDYKNFFISLGKVLPCQMCGDNYQKHFEKLPLTDDILKDKMKLIHWLIDIHNEVNRINGKKIYDYDTAIKIMLADFPNQESHIITKDEIKKNNNMIYTKKNIESKISFFSLLPIIIFTIIFIYQLKKKSD